MSYNFTSDGVLLIEDRRWGRSTIFTFNEAEASVYQGIDAPISFKQLIRKLSGTPAENLTSVEVETILEQFIQSGLALFDGTFYLSIAVAANSIDPSYEFRRCQFAKEPANQLSEKKRQAKRMVET